MEGGRRVVGEDMCHVKAGGMCDILGHLPFRVSHLRQSLVTRYIYMFSQMVPSGSLNLS